MRKEIPRINNCFVHTKGEYFNKVREVAFKSGELIGNLGTYVNETKREFNMLFSDDNLSEGVYIYQTFSNPLIAYRIYKTFADYGFNGDHDDKLIQKLMEKQSKSNIINIIHIISYRCSYSRGKNYRTRKSLLSF